MPYVSDAQRKAVWASRNERGEKTPTRMMEKATPITKKPKEKSFLNKAGHLALDVLGLVPVVGNVADGINAAWYTAEGDLKNAGLSAAAAIPGAGYAAFGAKMLGKAAKASKPVVNVGKSGKFINTSKKILKDPSFYTQNAKMLLRDEEDLPYFEMKESRSMGSKRIPQGSGGWKKANTTARSMGLSLTQLVNRRNSAEKGSAEYAAAQNAINRIYGSKKRY
jgi:hypothetical protein